MTRRFSLPVAFVQTGNKTRVMVWVFRVLALLSIPLLAVLIYAVFAQHDFYLNHDEAEHLHLVFALERGERPYRDFIENHPVLPHLLLSALRQPLGAEDPSHVYFLAKGVAAVHFVGCLALLLLWLVRHRIELGISFSPVVLLPIVIVLLGVWNDSAEWFWGHEALWQVRPDWVCNFWALASILLFLEAVRCETRSRAIAFALLAGIASGFATAIMAKSVFLIVPAIFTVLLTGFRIWSAGQISSRRSIIVLAAFSTYAGIGLVGFVMMVAWELHASHASLLDYMAANFKLNSIKHIVPTSEDFSPINVLHSLSGLNLPMAALLITWGFSKAARTLENRSWLAYGLMVFSGTTILLNITLPAYSNGLSWPQYFIPSLLVLAVIGVVVLDELTVAASALEAGQSVRMCATTRTWIRISVPLALALTLSIGIFHRWHDAIQRIDGLSHDNEVARALTSDNDRTFLPDRLLPNDLTYLTFAPQNKPLSARSWGYFHMLGLDRNIWRDNYIFGIGPDPQYHWARLYATNPPDVILVPDQETFLLRRILLYRTQGVDLAWLGKALERDYSCLTKMHVSVHVRHSLRDRFAGDGWKTCQPHEERSRKDIR